MNKAMIKSAYLKIQASDEFKYKTVALLQRNIQKSVRRRLQPFIAVTASLVMIISLVAVFSLFHLDNYFVSHNSVTIPKISLTKNNQMSMIGLVVYNDKVYTQTGSDIDIKSAVKLLGDKLGTAKGNIDEWSKKDNYAVELASNFTGDVYTVKGYDSNFRIMGIHKDPDGGKESAVFFEYLNGITVSSGKDLFGKLNMKGNALSLTYIQWSNGEKPIYAVNDDILINGFIEALNGATPLLFNQIPNLDWNNSSDVRNIRIELKDGCNVKLTLRKGGYIFYGNCDVAFKMNDNIFSKLWDRLDYSKDTSVKDK